MHDFFVDRMVHVGSFSGLFGSITRKVRQGGGGVHGIPQEEVRGGNAVNLAHALARLGLRTLLITHSDLIHEQIVRNPFEGLDAEVKIKPKPPGLTVALEGKVNVMLSQGGAAADFGPEMLDQEDWEALTGCRAVCSVNWAANYKGTTLLAALRRRLGRGKVIFLDPADFRDRLREFASLLALVRDQKLVDWMSLNEQEALEAARIMGVKATNPGELCAGLGKSLRAATDVHTANGSFTSDGGEVTAVRTRPIIPRRLTGAGDVWDAGSIYGRLKNFTDSDRLRFANTAASLYLTAADPSPPKLGDVLRAKR
jgi:sugar/nucleoside kinase (ribokinase family)